MGSTQHLLPENATANTSDCDAFSADAVSPAPTDNTHNTSPIRILLIDRHPITLLGLSSLLTDKVGCIVVDALSSADNVAETVKRQQPDIVLMDIHMPDVDGVKFVREVFAASGNTAKVVILTAALKDNETCDLISCGVKGILLKEMRPALILQCVRKVHDGGEWLERRSMMQAFEQVLRQASELQAIADHLSPRELELAILIATGCNNKTASQRLFISEGSVRVYLTRIYNKLQVPNRLQLALYFKEKGLT